MTGWGEASLRGEMRLLTVVQRSNKTFDAQDRVKSNGLAILLLEEILVRSLSAGRIKLLAVQLLAVGDVGERHLLCRGPAHWVRVCRESCVLEDSN